MEKKRVIIIGAGVLGLFAAKELLADDNFEITVLDQAFPGDGSSGRSVGMVETQYFTRPAVEVRAYGRKIYQEMIENFGIDFTHGGYLRLGATDQDLEKFNESLEIQKEFGITDAETLTVAEMSYRWPQLNLEGIKSGLFGSWDGFVDGHQICQILATYVKENGGMLFANTKVASIEKIGDNWVVTAGDKQFKAEYIVNAAGPHGAQIAEMIGAPVPLLPQLHGAITVKLPDLKGATPFVMDYIPGTGVEGVYFRSEGTNHLIAGLHTEEAIGEQVDPDIPLRSVSDDVIEKIAELLMQRLHGADEMELDRSWQGIYPMTPDHHPIAGAHPKDPTIICALGGGGSGIQLGPAIGKIAADSIRATKKPAFALNQKWDPARFQTKQS